MSIVVGRYSQNAFIDMESGKQRTDKSTVGGLLLAFLAIGAGLVLEGGQLVQVIQPTAALIVFGGTIGAIMVQFPLTVVLDAGASLGSIFREPKLDLGDRVKQLVMFSHKARREGLVSLDSYVPGIDDVFLKRAIMLAVDGTDPSELRETMRMEIQCAQDREELIARVFESAGGFAPTIGIMGAVLGLIQVMQHLGNVGEIGKGIAVAFVATMYGVGSANLFFLPAAGKLRIRLQQAQVLQEMTLEGVIAISEATNPRTIQNRLTAFVSERGQLLERKYAAAQN